jgi:SAM-dependent methyltransferase
VIDAGCGAGPLASLLADDDYRVTGIDQSSNLLAIAREEVPGAEWIHGSVFDVPFPAAEGIIALGEPLNYHDDISGADARVTAFFRKAAAALPPGGVFIFDVIETGEDSLSGRTWSSGESWAVLVETTEYPEEKRLVRNIHTFCQEGALYRRGREIHQVRIFESERLVTDLRAAGFEVETALSYGTYKLAPRRRAFFTTRIQD